MNLLEDMQKAYQGTYIQVRKGLELFPFYVHELDVRNGNMVGTILRKRQGSWVTYKDNITTGDFNLTLPELGYVNFKFGDIKNAAFLSLSPDRQWKKGLHERNISGTDRMGLRNFAPAFNSPESIWNIFNPSYNIKIADLSSADRAMALSPKLAIARTAGVGVIIYYVNNPVGYVQHNKVFLFRAFSHLCGYISKFELCEVE